MNENTYIKLAQPKLNKKLILLKGWFGVLHKERAICQAFKPSSHPTRFIDILFYNEVN